MTALTSAYDRLPLNALRVFEAVATRLNFSDAAEALHVTPAAVSQQIKTLEDYLQTPLLLRNGRGVQLTLEGTRLLPGLRRGLDELESALQQIRQERETGTVNVTHPLLLSAEVAHAAAGRTCMRAIPESTSTSTPRRRWSTSRVPTFTRPSVSGTGRRTRGCIARRFSMSTWWRSPLPRFSRSMVRSRMRAGLDKLPLLHGTEIDWSQLVRGRCRGSEGAARRIPG